MWGKSRRNRWTTWLVGLGLGLVFASPHLAQDPGPLRIPRNRMTHAGSVIGVDYRQNGKLLASASYSVYQSSGEVKLWDPATNKELVSIKTDRTVYSMAISPEGRTITWAHGDGKIHRWDVKAGKELDPLNGHKVFVRSLVFSPDGKTLASGSDDKTIKLWDTLSGKQVATLEGHNNPVGIVAFSLDGTTLASASEDKTIKLWDVSLGKTPKTPKTLKVNASKVGALAFSPDGKTLVSGSDQLVLSGIQSSDKPPVFQGTGFPRSDGQLTFWDVATGKILKTIDTGTLRQQQWSESGSERGRWKE